MIGMLGVDSAQGIQWNRAQLVVLVDQRTAAGLAASAVAAPASLSAAAPAAATSGAADPPAAAASAAAPSGAADPPAAAMPAAASAAGEASVCAAATRAGHQVVGSAIAFPSNTPADGIPVLPHTAHQMRWNHAQVSHKCDQLERMSAHARIAEFDRLLWILPGLASECMLELDTRRKNRIRDAARNQLRVRNNEVLRVRRAIAKGRPVAVDSAGQVRSCV